MNFEAKQIRNICVIGHGSEGKTTLVEAMLYNAGATDRMGKVEDGSTTTDYDPEEIKRQISISAGFAPIEWGGCKINLIDVPGYFDFIGELTAGLKLADGALIVVGAVSGVVVGAEKAWDNCVKESVPKMIVINQMDRENADFNKVLGQLRDKYGTSITPIQLPIMEGGAFAGYVDIINKSARLFDKKAKFKDADIPGELEDAVEEIREAVIEAAAENDDVLLEKFFGGEELTNEEIMQGLRAGVIAGKVVPVACASGAQNLNANTLADAIIAFMPSLADMPPVRCKNPKTGEDAEVTADASKPFAAHVIKTMADPFVGKLSIFKIYQGTLTADMPMHNPDAGKNEKVGTLYIMRGKKQIAVDKLQAGDIGAVAKLQYTMTGHTLCDPGNPVKFDAIEFPRPSISLAVSAQKEGEEDKVFSGLHRLEEEDPTFRVEKQVETGDMLMQGLGELHLEVLCRKLKNKFGVEAELKEPKIPYRETIRKSVKAEGKHKKQSGGHGQYGHCWIEFEPIMDGSADFEFIDKIVGGVVPRQYIPAVEKGLRESVARGVLAGYPVVGIRCTLYDGSFHSVDSSEMAFKTAARLAFKKGCALASPVLLEPIYRVEVLIPDEYMGDVIGDINRRRGRVMGMNPSDGLQEVVAEVPLSEMFKYSTDLRSMTQARGSFTMNFERYDEVPGNIAAKVIERAKQDMEDTE
ncbi:MAG: elongation factor G [Bacillota bacterium]